MYSPLGLVIFVAVEGTFVCFTKGRDHFISNYIRCGCLRNDQCNTACLQTEMHSQLAAAPLRGGDELCRVISAVRVIQIHRKDFTCGRLATPTASQIGRYLYPLARASFAML